MNALVLDPAGDLAGADVAALAADAGVTGVVGRAAPAAGSAGWEFAFTLPDGDRASFRTRGEPEGLACAVLLACDQFPADEPLALLGPDAADWPVHFARLAAARRHGLDVFLSFPGDGPPHVDPAPDLTALLRRCGGVSPALAWYRTAGLFLDAAKQVVRKDARFGGRFTADSVLRELALHDARVAYHGTPWELHAPAAM